MRATGKTEAGRVAAIRPLARWIAGRLARAYPEARCTLDHATPLELYVATVLSAQCTDARVNQVTPELFRRCPTPEAYLELGQAGLEKMIHSTGFFRNKAKSILGTCARMVEAFGGEVPSSMDELLTLPGVGRKTANVILGASFGRQEGIAVDTHVARVSRRLGLTDQEDPVKIEADLMALFPRTDWTSLSHRIILHGRQVCAARAPRCDACLLAQRCPFAARGRGTPSGARHGR
ncbi:MAG: endonuclease III [Candidatus Eisenbacteria bacterium]|nr:endonuclease III [Candidatus Eisenbacteria bacterium]